MFCFCDFDKNYQEKLIIVNESFKII